MSECQNCSPWYSCDECNQKFAERRSVDPMTKAEQPTITQSLRPCPFCGGADLRVAYLRCTSEVKFWRVECAPADCDCMGPSKETEAEAIAAWNTRTTSLAAQDGLVEAAGELAFAEAEYRRKHDLCGRGHIDTGRAWDRMRRAGDRVRAALASIEVES